MIYLLASLLGSAFFSASETAFIRSSNLHVAVLKKRGTWQGKILTYLNNHYTYFLSILLLGNTLCLVFYTVFMSSLLSVMWVSWYQGMSSWLELVCNTVICAAIALVLVEFLPKAVALMRPEKLLEFLAPLLVVIYGIGFPITFIFVKFSHLLIRQFTQIEPTTTNWQFKTRDLYHYFQNVKVSTEGDEEPVDEEILSKVLNFGNITVKQCLVQRNNIVAMRSDKGIPDLQELFLATGHSKILIYDETIDNVIGFCHVLELFSKPKQLKDMIKKLPIITESMRVKEVMLLLSKEKKTIALVVDEFGGTAGILCVEDIIEEIIGEVEDEHDAIEQKVIKINDTTFNVMGTTEIDELNEKYHIPVPQGDYETISGYILSLTQNIPEEKQVVQDSKFTFTIQKVNKARIELVEIKF